MRVVFIGCKPFKGIDKCGFQFSFYENHFKIGDIYEVSKHYDNMSDVFNVESSVIFVEFPFKESGKGKTTCTFPIEHFISLEEWIERRDKKIEQLGL